MRISDWSSDVCSSDLDAIDELTDYERDSLRDLLPHIIEETPRTPAAGFKVIAIIGHLAGPAKTLLREAVFSIAADVAKKAKGMGRSEERGVGKAWVRTCRSRG